MSFTNNLRPHKWLSLLAFIVMNATLVAQSWVDAKVVNNGQSLSWSKQVLIAGSQIILEPDPALGSVNLNVVGNELTIEFISVAGVEGVAEFVVEHFAPSFPFNLITSAYRVEIAASFINAHHDYVAVTQGDPATSINPLGNDDFEGGVDVGIRDIAVSPNGTATVSPDGQTIEFEPTAGYSGMTYLTYVVCDEYGACDDAEINICVLPDGPLPALDTIYLSTDNKTPVTAFVPIPGMTISKNVANGAVASMSAEAWEYTPNSSFVGKDILVLSSGGQQTRVIVFDVLSQFETPDYLEADHVFTPVGKTLTFDARDNDFRKFPIQTFSMPDHGTLSINDNEFTFVPEPGYTGVTEFTYQIRPLFVPEQTTVKITVGDLAPVADKRYKLSTQRNSDLVINYDIPLTGYHMMLTNAEPDNGQLVLKDGNSTHSSNCGDISGYDLIVYSPATDFVGDDQFEIEFESSNGVRERVKIDVEVQDVAVDECGCVENCVWPGDVNADGQVDMSDLLSIGWHIGSTGPPREEVSEIKWQGYDADDWSAVDPGTGMNLKYFDCDGDGIITERDADFIKENYLEQHSLIPDYPGDKADFYFSIIPPEGPVSAGELAEFKISLGNATQPVLDMHGVQFSLNLPQGLFVPGSVSMDFLEASWLGHGAPNLEIDVVSKDGRVDAGFTRTTGVAASGHGIVLTMVFIVVDDIEGFAPLGTERPYTVSIDAASSSNAKGQLEVIEDAETTIFVSNLPATIDEPEQRVERNLSDKARIYPNPTSTGFIEVQMPEGGQANQVTLYDITGRVQGVYDVSGQAQTSLDVTALSTGMYFIRIDGDAWSDTQKIEIAQGN